MDEDLKKKKKREKKEKKKKIYIYINKIMLVMLCILSKLCAIEYAP